MKIKPTTFLALAVLLAGCASEPPLAYHAPLVSPGGQFSTLPPTVQNTVRAQVGMAAIDTISRETSDGSTIYVFHFQNADVYPPLLVASDGSVLTPDLNVAVGATEESIEASIGRGSNGVRINDLPRNVITAIRINAPTAEIDSISQIIAGSDVFYEVFFKNPEHHPKLLITADGRVVR